MYTTIGSLTFFDNDSIDVEFMVEAGEYYFTFDKSGKFKAFWDVEMTKPLNKNETMSALRRVLSRVKREETKAATR